MDHLAPADHQESRVSQVGRVQLVALPVQHHNAGRAAAYGWMDTFNSNDWQRFELSIKIKSEYVLHQQNILKRVKAPPSIKNKSFLPDFSQLHSLESLPPFMESYPSDVCLGTD